MTHWFLAVGMTWLGGVGALLSLGRKFCSLAPVVGARWEGRFAPGPWHHACACGLVLWLLSFAPVSLLGLPLCICRQSRLPLPLPLPSLLPPLPLSWCVEPHWAVCRGPHLFPPLNLWAVVFVSWAVRCTLRHCMCSSNPGVALHKGIMVALCWCPSAVCGCLRRCACFTCPTVVCMLGVHRG